MSALDNIKPYAKAIAAFLVPAAGALLISMQDGSPGGSAIIGNEYLAAFLLCVSTSGVVLGVPNKDPKGLKQDESVQPPAGGAL